MLRDPNVSPTWGAHVDGAAAILRLRGVRDMNSPLGRGLFSFVRKSVVRTKILSCSCRLPLTVYNQVIGHLQTCLPIDEAFSAPEPEVLSNDPESHLVSIAAKIPDLQHQRNVLFSQAQEPSEHEIAALASRARTLEQQISEWRNTLPLIWLYSTAANVTESSGGSGAEFVLEKIHRYHDFYTARVWNFYRVSRLIVQSVLIRALSSSSDPTDPNKHGEIEKIEEQSADLIDQICASVPFLLGLDLAKMQLPAPGHVSAQKNENAAHSGRFSLIWPLHVASSCPSIPEAQRSWMRGHLKAMADQGEAQARIVCLTKSQILAGGSDIDRFDCV
jgi:hypothetical protein